MVSRACACIGSTLPAVPSSFKLIKYIEWCICVWYTYSFMGTEKDGGCSVLSFTMFPWEEFLIEVRLLAFKPCPSSCLHLHKAGVTADAVELNSDPRACTVFLFAISSALRYLIFRTLNCAHACVCHCTHMEVEEQLVGLGTHLLPCGSGDQMQTWWWVPSLAAPSHWLVKYWSSFFIKKCINCLRNFTQCILIICTLNASP